MVWTYQNIFLYQSNKVINEMNWQRQTGLHKPVLFKDIREKTVVHAVVIAYYWTFYINSAEIACSDHVVACSDHVVFCSLSKLELSVDVLVAG